MNRVTPWYWRFMPVLLAYELRRELRALPFGATHGEATYVPASRTVTHA